MSRFFLAWLAAVSLSAGAAEIKVLTAGALKPLVTALAPEIERATGHRIVVESDTAGALTKRVAAGEAVDVLVVTKGGVDELLPAIEELITKGRVAAGSRADLAKVGIGVVVKSGTPRPDIISVDAFKKTLIAAKSVAYIDPQAGGSSGIYLARLFERMGIAEDIRRKAVLVPGGLTAQKLVSGEADIALQQMSELMVVPGATVVGPIPAEVQNYTVYVGAVGASARDAVAARAVLAALAGASATAWMAGKGLEPP